MKRSRYCRSEGLIQQENSSFLARTPVNFNDGISLILPTASFMLKWGKYFSVCWLLEL